MRETCRRRMVDCPNGQTTDRELLALLASLGSAHLKSGLGRARDDFGSATGASLPKSSDARLQRATSTFYNCLSR
jgi:hypothetical protein